MLSPSFCLICCEFQSNYTKLLLLIKPISIVVYSFTLSQDNLCWNSCILALYMYSQRYFQVIFCGLKISLNWLSFTSEGLETNVQIFTMLTVFSNIHFKIITLHYSVNWHGQYGYSLPRYIVIHTWADALIHVNSFNAQLDEKPNETLKKTECKMLTSAIHVVNFSV